MPSSIQDEYTKIVIIRMSSTQELFHIFVRFKFMYHDYVNSSLKFVVA